MTNQKKTATEYLKDYWYKSKVLGIGIETNMDDLLSDAKAMGPNNLKELMIDFYEYKIIPVIDI